MLYQKKHQGEVPQRGFKGWLTKDKTKGKIILPQNKNKEALVSDNKESDAYE